MNKRFLCLLLCAFLLASPVAWAQGLQAGKVQLTADKMVFDTETGVLRGTGHVTLKQEEMSVTSDRCTGDYKKNTARMWGNVTADGNWQGQPLSFVCQDLKASFSSPGRLAMVGAVDGRFGGWRLVCYDAELVGEQFIATRVKRFEDQTEGMFLSCEAIRGALNDDGLNEFEAEGAVRLEFVNRKDGKLSRITGGKAVYARRRGTVVMSGGALAVQGGRRIAAQNIVYYPTTGKIEAKGKPRVTFDVE